MKKNSTKGYLILGILFALVSVIVFVVPVERTAAFWVAYAFSVVSFAAQIVIWKAALGREEALKSKFLGLPVVHIGMGYLAIQTLALGVFRFVPALPVWSAVIACAVIAGVSAVCMIASDVGRGEIERVEARVQSKVFRIREMQTEVERLANAEKDAAAKATLAQLAEKLRFSDPMSDDQLADLENRIGAKIAELSTAADKTAIIEELDSLLEERNRKCKTLK